MGHDGWTERLRQCQANMCCFDEIIKPFAIFRWFADLLQSHGGWTERLPHCQANIFCQNALKSSSFCQSQCFGGGGGRPEEMPRCAPSHRLSRTVNIEGFADLLQSHGEWTGRPPQWHQWCLQPSPHLLLTRHSGH